MCSSGVPDVPASNAYPCPSSSAGCFTINSSSEITVSTPAAAAGTVNVTVITPLGDSPISSADRYTYSTPGAYTPVTPFRVCDTRPTSQGITANQCNDDSTGAGSGPLTSGAKRVVTVDGFGGLPGSGVTAVVVNVTAIAPTSGTFLTLYPDGGSVPATSNLNPQAGAIVANLVEVAVSTAGKIDVFNALGTINVALDIQGYVSSASTGLFTARSRQHASAIRVLLVAALPLNATYPEPIPSSPAARCSPSMCARGLTASRRPALPAIVSTSRPSIQPRVRC